MIWKPILALMAASVLAVSALPAGGVQARPATAGPGDFYLALGDSLAVGYQPDPHTSWTHGWVYQFGAMLNTIKPVVVTDLGINGECTGTFIKGGLDPACTPKKVDSPSQLAEAVSFIKAHPGRVNPITIDIGSNNIQGVQYQLLGGTATQRQALLGKIFPPLTQDWVTIFGTLRHACGRCEIIAVNQYNPIPHGVLKFDMAPMFNAYNGLLLRAAATANVRVADVYKPFVGHELLYTWISKQDNHPTNIGYTVMANTVAKVSAYAIPPQG